MLPRCSRFQKEHPKPNHGTNQYFPGRGPTPSLRFQFFLGDSSFLVALIIKRFGVFSFCELLPVVFSFISPPPALYFLSPWDVSILRIFWGPPAEKNCPASGHHSFFHPSLSPLCARLRICRFHRWPPLWCSFPFPQAGSLARAHCWFIGATRWCCFSTGVSSSVPFSFPIPQFWSSSSSVVFFFRWRDPLLSA